MNRVPMGCCDRISLIWLIGSQVASAVMLLLVWKREKPVHEDSQGILFIFAILPFVTSICILLYALLRFYLFALAVFLVNAAEMLFLCYFVHLLLSVGASRIGTFYGADMFHAFIKGAGLQQYYTAAEYPVNDSMTKIQEEMMTPIILIFSSMMTSVSCFFTLIKHVVEHRPFQGKPKPVPL